MHLLRPLGALGLVLGMRLTGLGRFGVVLAMVSLLLGGGAVAGLAMVPAVPRPLRHGNRGAEKENECEERTEVHLLDFGLRVIKKTCY